MLEVVRSLSQTLRRTHPPKDGNPAAGLRQESERPMSRWISLPSLTRHAMGRRVLCVIGLVVAGVALALPVAAAEVGEIDPCQLVTKQEAQVVLGAAVASETSPPARANKNGVRICSIQGTNGRALTVFVGSKTKAAFDREKNGTTPVGGIGDDAYVVPPGVVTVRKGERVLTLSINLTDTGHDAGLLEQMKTLARAAAGRM